MKKVISEHGFALIGEKSNETGIALYVVSNHWQRAVRDRLQPLGITVIQLLLLNAVAALENSKVRSNQVNIALYAGCDKMMASKVLRDLAKQKLIRRKKLNSDARAIGLSMTEAGIQVLRAAVPIYQQANEAFFDKMKKEGKWREKLLKLLEE
jgi:DNA-binding MarR family transcriptional regulator